MATTIAIMLRTVPEPIGGGKESASGTTTIVRWAWSLPWALGQPWMTRRKYEDAAAVPHDFVCAAVQDRGAVEHPKPPGHCLRCWSCATRRHPVPSGSPTLRRHPAARRPNKILLREEPLTGDSRPESRTAAGGDRNDDPQRRRGPPSTGTTSGTTIGGAGHGR
jgi:hypothetical protein